MMEAVGFLGAAYPWVKAAHLIFVTFWMAGLFMLPRFFAYHQETAAGSPEIAAWIEREARLVKIILNPAMIIVWALGLILTINIGAWAEGWFYAKFAAVIALSGHPAVIAGQRNDYREFGVEPALGPRPDIDRED